MLLLLSNSKYNKMITTIVCRLNVANHRTCLQDPPGFPIPRDWTLPRWTVALKIDH